MGGGLPNVQRHALLTTDPCRKLTGVGRDNILKCTYGQMRDGQNLTKSVPDPLAQQQETI